MEFSLFSTNTNAQLCYIMFSTCVITGVHYGTGRHFADLEPENGMKALRVRAYLPSSNDGRLTSCAVLVAVLHSLHTHHDLR
jgi:hypothetical protein